MVVRAKKQKRGSISEENISTVLQRHSATTVLDLLQEVAHVEDVKIDWNELVKKTKTGISSAREYQMLWRHLAYRDALLERLDDGAQPLDDDSDLEYELEAFPAVSSEASTEAAACVKVLIASGLPSDSSLLNGSTVEAPLTINIPNGQSTRAPENSKLSGFMQGMNITVPVSVQKQPLPSGTYAGGLDANGSASGNLPARRKRKPWSEAEDMELIAAVQKCGEGNWANILKGDFKGDRTASQLSQRWSIIRKKNKNSSGIGGGSQLSEAQLAARRAVSLALDMPVVDKAKAPSSIGSSVRLSGAAETSSAGTQSKHQTEQDSVTTVSKRSKCRAVSKKQSGKSALNQDDIKATAVKVGARVLRPSEVAKVKATQAMGPAVHLMPALNKTSMAGNANSLPRPPNVHYIRTGLATTPPSTSSSLATNASRPDGAQQVQGHNVKIAALTIQSCPSTTTPETKISDAINSAAASIPAKELEVVITEDTVIPSSGNATEELIQEEDVYISGDGERELVLRKDHVQEAEVGKEQCAEIAAEIDQNVIGLDQESVVCKNTNDDGVVQVRVEDGDNTEAVDMEICEKQCVNGKLDDCASMVVDGKDEQVEPLGNVCGTNEGAEEDRMEPIKTE